MHSYTAHDPPAPEIKVMSLAQLTRDGSWRLDLAHDRPDHLLIWITRGQGVGLIGGARRGLGLHNALFIPARTLFALDLNRQVFGHAVVIPEGAAPSLTQDLHHLRIRDVSAQAELTGILDQLQREADGDRPGRARSIEAYAGLLSVWLERVMQQQEDDLAANSASRRLARRFSELVEKDFHTGRGVSYYAERLGVTSTHLTRVCKQTCGSTASEFLAERKFSEARRLLADTRKPVKQIAAELGFASPAYFTRAFQGRCGQSPRSFRTGH